MPVISKNLKYILESLEVITLHMQALAGVMCSMLVSVII